MMLPSIPNVLASSSSPASRRHSSWGGRGDACCHCPRSQLHFSAVYPHTAARATLHAARSHARLTAAPPVGRSPRSAACLSRVASLKGVPRWSETPPHVEAASDRRREPMPPPASYRVDGVALGRETKWMRLWKEIRKMRKKENKGKKEGEKEEKGNKKRNILFIFRNCDSQILFCLLLLHNEK
jgi:hypothetical protein